MLFWSNLTVKWNIDFPFPGAPPGGIASYSTWAQGAANGAVPNSLVVSDDGRLLVSIENYYGPGANPNIVSYTPPATSFNPSPVVS